MIAHSHTPNVLQLPTKLPAQLPKQLALTITQQHPTTLYLQQQWPNMAYMKVHRQLHCFFQARAQQQSQIVTRSPKYELACETGLAMSTDTASLHGRL